MRSIDIIEADANNLADVSVHIPSRAVTLVMRVSGSGKTSLLQHTLALEGDRLNQVFLDLPSSYDEARQSRAFIGPLPPMVHVGQRGFRASVRTTVGTATGLLATMRRLFLALGVPYSDDAKAMVAKPDASTYADWLQR